MAKTIYDIIAEKFPGVELESPVQGWVYLEEYEKGIRAHQDMIQVHTTAYDDRWLGVCYFLLNDDLKASELFYRAIARLDEGARINLAFAFFFTERTNDMITELKKVDFQNLNKYDKALYLRVKSYYEEASGDIRSALRDAEYAWEVIQGIPELPILAPQILNQLGILYARIGRSQRALWYIERSLELSSGIEQKKGLLRRAYLLTILGAYEEALADLESLNTSSTPVYLKAELFLRLGDVTWAMRNVGKAVEHYEQAMKLALKNQRVFEEFLARLALASIFGVQSLVATAGEHLARAKVLISDRSDELAYLFCDVLVSRFANELTPQQTVDELTVIAKEFGEMGLLQEQGWVKLHIAEMHRQLGDEASMSSELDELQKLAVVLQNNSFLAREWTLVPKLREVALQTHPKIAGKSPDVLEIYTMGEEKLVLNGKVVNVRMTKGVELIAYFLEHGKVSLKKMLLDVFADEQPKAARNYFHQFKHELNNRVPGLNLEYDADERLYELKTEADVLWDVAELRAGRKMGALGIFLPGSGSEWALLLENDVEPLKQRDEVFPVVKIARRVSVKS